MARMHMDAHERRVQIDRTKLLEQLVRNRNQHFEAYQEALEGYTKEFKLFLQESSKLLQDSARNIETTADAESFDRDALKKALYLPKKPENYLQAYDEAIKIFSWEEREVVELTVSEVLKFCEDEWDWKDAFVQMSAAYAAAR